MTRKTNRRFFMCRQNIQKVRLSIVLAIMVGTMFSSEASIDLHGLDSIDVMPEIIVTAPRYENQDEAISGRVESVVIEGQRHSVGDSGVVTRDKSQGMVRGETSSKDIETSSMQIFDPLFLLLLLALAVLLIAYVVFRAFLAAKEVKYAGPKH